ncbi:hypothetical protein FJZ31_24170 [Candidatus Poribacteria bacterium]|nr:hypothetical protein [Candidatus Poribacteria bacterium]
MDAAHYLEMWFPANLIYDQFKFTLDIEIAKTEFEHIIITNGSVAKLGKNHWRVEFPERFTFFLLFLLIKLFFLKEKFGYVSVFNAHNRSNGQNCFAPWYYYDTSG